MAGKQGQLRLVLPSTPTTAVDRLVSAVNRVVTAGGSLRLVDAVEHIVPLTAERFPLSGASFAKYRTDWRRFVRFAEAHQCLLVSKLDRDLCLAWITAPSVIDEYPVPPTADTQHGRRASLRNLFGRLRAYGAMDGDPTIDIRLPPRSLGNSRRLEDDEVDLCRLWAPNTLVDTRQPAAWALAEATATAGEIGQSEIGDVDIFARRVYLRGTDKVRARWARLTPWGIAALTDQIRVLGGNPGRRLAYDGAADGVNGQ